MRINRQIRVPNVRVISQTGEQIGVIPTTEAMQKAEEAGLDLVEIVPNSNPPVCKIIDYGKFRYDQTKREKENKKAQHQVKVKEIKFKPNINVHDFQTKIKRAREFLEKGNKVKCSCMFRGREMLHTEFGEKLMQKVIDELEDVSHVETPMKRFGRFINIVLAPSSKKNIRK